MREVDVVVVGAGPTGSNTARLMALRGWSVLLLEEHAEVGIPVQCAGLVTPRTFDHTPFPIGDLWQNDLTGGRIIAPDGTAVEFGGTTVHAQAMDRARFDQKMADHAVQAGAELWTSAKAVDALRDSSGVTVRIRIDAAKGLGPGEGGPATAAGRGPKGTQPPLGEVSVRARLLVGADGIRGSVARWFDFPNVEEIVSCYEAELCGVHIDADKPSMIPMFAGSSQAPGFFSWIIPVGKDAEGRSKARAGLAVAAGMNLQSAKAYYERMFTDPASAPYLKGATPSYLIIGGIPLGLRAHLVQDRVMLVGDAAGMAKPTSGGGIYYGLVASEFLAPVADRGLRSDRLDRGSLLPYERKTKRILGRELRKGKALRSIYKRFRDADFNRLARLLATPRARRAIEKVGDIDYPSRLVLPLLWAQPRLAPFFLRILLRPSS
ncbi:MAG: NAD(P)/FAD-dependent oxidoreductase [Candidatus Thermoplasmatota archaeon]